LAVSWPEPFVVGPETGSQMIFSLVSELNYQLGFLVLSLALLALHQEAAAKSKVVFTSSHHGSTS
jgi:hypothetical protein